MYIFVSLILKCVSLLLVCFWLLCKCNVWVDDCGSGAAEPKMIQIPILPDKRNGYVWVDESERERERPTSIKSCYLPWQLFEPAKRTDE